MLLLTPVLLSCTRPYSGYEFSTYVFRLFNFFYCVMAQCKCNQNTGLFTDVKEEGNEKAILLVHVFFFTL